MSSPGEAQRAAYATCAYCPKVCRFACPVSDATHRETVSTWGKMTTAHLAVEGKRPLDADSAQSLYACTGCMRCRTFCKHEAEVGDALFAARARVRGTPDEPPGAKSTRATFAAHQNPFGADLAAAVDRRRAEAPVRFQLFPGCTALVKRPKLIEDALAVGRGFSAAVGVCKASARCCGYPLYAAGDLAAFTAHAQRFAESLVPYPELAVLDPGCAYTLKVVYPRFGIELPNDIQTFYAVLGARIDQRLPKPPSLDRAVYHDACHLGRGLGEYDLPRALLRLAVETVAEGSAYDAEGGCSGGGGLLPRTHPQVAQEVARRQGQSAAPTGETLVTTCPTSSRMFERAGLRSRDLVTVLREWMDGNGGTA